MRRPFLTGLTVLVWLLSACGPTTSSGTGTCASSAAAMALGSTERELTAVAEGGTQRTVWPSSDAVMRLTGPAEIICVGEVSAL